ncbi:hypothetical protein OGAPHI_003257 [Ogataea philodendri]|uniref:C2H2-type domain-containing protein n=1 Tax=Ogataea philodendri TaxID=1378263 RepID=A0A9P8P755_9ASCO|nr:uncharacterized protein OGAPHI_003257 [Ogataea philodendri]KAH3666808.1 hypothetical protein OGAPHI_003257 [Ogataea philodendri]
MASTNHVRFFCQWTDCDAQFERQSDLAAHVTKHIAADSVCRWFTCGAVLESPSSLLSHLIRHSQTPFGCLKCPLEFESPESVFEHEQSHRLVATPTPLATDIDKYNHQKQSNTSPHFANKYSKLANIYTSKTAVPIDQVPDSALENHAVQLEQYLRKLQSLKTNLQSQLAATTQENRLIWLKNQHILTALKQFEAKELNI